MIVFLVSTWRFRVVALHFQAFFHRQLRQMANEEYQFPVVLRSMGGAKAGTASPGAGAPQSQGHDQVFQSDK